MKKAKEPIEELHSSEPHTEAADTSVLPIKKADKIKLQNIIFGSQERSLMTSDPFLSKMAKKYVSARMKVINDSVNSLKATKSPSKFFVYYDIAVSKLEELIKIESIYKFNAPVPSEYYKNLKEAMPKYTTHVLKLAWNYTLTEFPIELPVTDNLRRKYESLFDEMQRLSDKLSPEDNAFAGDIKKQFEDTVSELEKAEQTAAENAANANQQ